jgi:hypothetical protein
MANASVTRAGALFDERDIVKRVMSSYAQVAVAEGRYPSLVASWGAGLD